MVGTGAIAAGALVTGGLGASAANAVPLTDNANSIYGVRGPANSALNGGVFRIDTAAMSVVTPAEVDGQRNEGRSTNALGVSADGVFVYTVDNGTNGAANPRNAVQLRQHNTESGQTRTFDVPSAFGTTTLRGAVSPTTGIFYFSGAQTVYAFDPATDEIFPAGTLPQGTSNSNGDFTFGRNGTLYTFVAANLYQTPAASRPTSASTAALPMSLVASVSAFTALSSQGANGIAFGGNGNVFGTTTSGNNTYLIEYAGPVVAAADGSYSVSATASGTADLSNYTTSIVCADADGTPAQTTGAPAAWAIVFPTVTGGTDVECVITATPIPDVAPPSTDSGTSTGVQGVPQSWRPSPVAGEDFPIAAGSLTLVDAEGAPVDEVVLPGVGRFEVVGDEIVFTPEPAFVGPVPAVDYRVSDEGGQHATGTYSPTVTAVTPLADDDTSTGWWNTPQSVDPLHSDAPGDPDVPLVPGSLTLLDGEGNPATTVVVPDGVYTIDRTDADEPRLVFTPRRGFTGIPTPVDYRVLDANGTPAEAAYQPIVRGPEGNENLNQALVCETPMVFDVAVKVPGLDPSSVMLVDAETGVVTFIPAGCYVGPLTPVGWEGWLEDGTPMTGELSGTYSKPLVATGGVFDQALVGGAVALLLLGGGFLLAGRFRRAHS